MSIAAAVNGNVLTLTGEAGGPVIVQLGSGSADSRITEGGNAVTISGTATSLNRLDASALAGNIQITGNAAGATLIGGSGEDTLVGLAGNDTLIAGYSRNSITTGGGGDTIVLQTFGPGPNDFTTATIVSDFDPALDRIDVSALGIHSLEAFLSSSDNVNGGDTLFSFARAGDGQQLTLSGIAPSRLTAANFIFASTGAGIEIDARSYSQGEDTDYLYGTLYGDRLDAATGADRVYGDAGDDTIIAGAGNDVLDGGAGIDTVIFSGARADYTLVTEGNQVFVTHRNGGADGNDQLVDVERLQFTDQVVLIDIKVPPTINLSGNEVASEGDEDVTYIAFRVTRSHADSAFDPYVSWAVSIGPNDTADAADFGGTLPSGAFSFEPGQGFADIMVPVSGDRIIEASERFTLTLTGVQNGTLGSSISVTGIISNDDLGIARDETRQMLLNGAVVDPAPSNAGFGLEWALPGTAGDDIIHGTSRGDLINALEGNDAIEAGQGDDIIDGGRGSNFLSGGQGNDRFFIDGRGASGAAQSTVWSTITDFELGSTEEVTVFGWNTGISRVLLTVSSAGATGFQGATWHLDLDGDNIVDASITLTGLSLADLAQTIGETGGVGFFQLTSLH